jgi:SAM-dependent methyltransferase
MPSTARRITRDDWRDDAALWGNEFGSVRIIPSSTRQLPSKPLLRLLERVDLTDRLRILDAGSGNGRNALYLAALGLRVVAVDVVDELLTSLEHKARDRGIASLITPVKATLKASLPFEAGSFDLVLDSYVSCHFIRPSTFAAYWSEVRRILVPGGLAYSSQFATDDGYYARLAQSTDGGITLATDPANGVTKRLFTESELVAELAPILPAIHLETVRFEDVVEGAPYERSVIGLLLESGGSSIGDYTDKRGRRRVPAEAIRG